MSPDKLYTSNSPVAEAERDNEAISLHTSYCARSVVCDQLDTARVFDDFLIQCPDAHLEQSTGWAKLKRVDGWTPKWVWVTRGTKILGGAMILTRWSRLAAIGYVERGPVWDATESESMELVTESVYQLARSLRLTYLVIVPPYSGGAVIPLLESLHFRRKPEPLPPSGVVWATLLIDLRQDVDALLADMSMTKRQNIRRAIRNGVRIRIGGSADADLVRDLMWKTCKRRGIAPSPPQKDYFKNLWDVLGPSGCVKFFIAEIEGQPVAAACARVFGGMMQLWRVGWSGTDDRSNPNDLLHWEMIRWAKQNGCRTFDFMHIRPDHARAILRGEKITDSYSGVTNFKTSFGGQLRILPELYYRSFHPVVHGGLQIGAARLLESRTVSSVLGKAANRIHEFRRR